MTWKLLGSIGATALIAAGVGLTMVSAAAAQDKSVSFGTWMWTQPGSGDWLKLAGAKFEKDNPGVKLDGKYYRETLLLNELLPEIKQYVAFFTFLPEIVLLKPS